MLPTHPRHVFERLGELTVGCVGDSVVEYVCKKGFQLLEVALKANGTYQAIIIAWYVLCTLVPRPPHPAFVACSTKSGEKAW